MSISIYNSTISPLISGQVFSGAVYDNILDFAEIDISILCDTGYTLEYIYSQNKVDVNYTTTQIIPFSASTQFYKAPVLDRYFKIQITATDGDMILLNVQTIYKSVITFTEGYGADVNIISPLDANGYVEVSAMNLVPLPSANIRTPSQLIVNDWYKVESLGNTPGAVWAEMGAIIGSESFPPIGRVFKCLEPRYGTGTVSTVVYSQNTYDVNLAQCISSSNVNVLVNNTTPISVGITGTVAATQSGDWLVGLTGPVGITGTVAATQSGDWLVGLTGPVGITGTVAISNTAFDSNITNTFLTVKAKPTYSISIDSASNTSQNIRSSAGVLHTVIITSVNTTFPLLSICDYVKIYNSSSATSADAPLAIIPIRYGESTVFQADMNFSAGLCVRATSLYSIGDSSVPASTIYLTCFLTGYSE